MPAPSPSRQDHGPAFAEANRRKAIPAAAGLQDHLVPILQEAALLSRGETDRALPAQTLGQFEEIGAKEIGRHSSMHKTKASRAVQALEERRWLRRRESEADRREEILTLTASGRKAYREIVPKAVAFERRILDGLGPKAESVLNAVEWLEKISKAL